jgi:tetratricopeptide (TPR) repeat protein
MKNWKLQLVVIALLCPAGAGAQASSPSEAMALEQQGKLDEAARVWKAVVERNPRDAGAFASLGVVFSKEKRYPEAASAYRKAIALDPGLPGIQLNLGLAEFKQGHFQAAIAPLSAALAAQPNNVQARALLGLSYYGAKQFAEASKHLEVAARADPDNTQLRQVLAHSCLWAKNFDCALEEFRDIEQRDPDSAAAHMLTGEALDGLGRTPEAIAEFEAAAKISPREPEVHFGIGFLQWKLRHYDEAESALRTELSIDSNNAQALAYLGDIEMKANDLDKALPLLEKAVKVKGGDVRIAYVDLGAVLMQQKRYQDAMAALQHAVKLDPAQPDSHFRLGRLYQEMGNTTAAQQEYAKVRELHEKAADDVASKMHAQAPAVPQ